MTTTDSQRIPSVGDDEPGLPTAGVQRIKIDELTFEKLIGEGVISLIIVDVFFHLFVINIFFSGFFNKINVIFVSF
jgi:hypothetical protein